MRFANAIPRRAAAPPTTRAVPPKMPRPSKPSARIKENNIVQT